MYKDRIEPRLKEIVQLRSKGISTEKIAAYLGIEVHELQLAIQDNQDLYNAWYKGEVFLIEEIENALYRAAKGQYVEEEETIETIDGEGEITRTTKVKKKFVQSIPAAIKALEVIHNRRWANVDRESKEIEIILPRELLEYAE